MTGGGPAARPWAALGVLCLGNYLILLDTSIVNTAAPALMESLGTGVGGLLWVLNGYLLALASLLIVFSRLGDLWGARTVFVTGLAVFALASLLCALAQSTGQLVAARVVQGVGAAAMLPQALVLIAAVFPEQRRGAAFGVFTAVGGVAAVTGPTVGGVLVTHVGWQSVFVLNVPLAVWGLAAARRFVPDVRAPRPRGFDVVGVGLVTFSLVALVSGLIEGERHGWGRLAGPVTVPAVLVAGVLGLGLFVWWEHRHPAPLVPPALLRERTFAVTAGITLVTSFALHGFLLVFVITTQRALGMSPQLSGMTALPWTLTLSAVAPLAGRLSDRVDVRRLLAAGLLCHAAAVAAVALLAERDWTSWSYFWVLTALGIGMGLTIAPTTSTGMRAVAAPLAGAASGVLNTARQVGAALGAAVTGAVLQHRLDAAVPGGGALAGPPSGGLAVSMPDVLLAAARPALGVSVLLLVLAAAATVLMARTTARSEKTAGVH
ncbi:MFS transporter [Catellatospora coxensis]|uniref:MFS transporter n=1 Tax=Catellatospora coxensis TaxID=310354 RepID=A0A8J3L9N4_9ACTN|nr:MFS transporter [Catellatospora coxensis]GIG10600.1 MFS transporter [Catellatospora coxensis]